MTFPTKELLIENMAKAIFTQCCNTAPVATNVEDLWKVEQVKKSFKKQAEVALHALINSFPCDNSVIESKARELQLECIEKNPNASTIPSIYHYKAQLGYLDKDGEYYKQLLNYKD